MHRMSSTLRLIGGYSSFCPSVVTSQKNFQRVEYPFIPLENSTRVAPEEALPIRHGQRRLSFEAHSVKTVVSHLPRSIL
jgi:hypothetical protein